MQISPEVLTGVGDAVGPIPEVETQFVQMSPELQTGTGMSISKAEYQSAMNRIKLLEKQLAEKDSTLKDHESQAAASSSQLKEALRQKEDELELRANAFVARDKEWEDEMKLVNAE